VEKHYERRQHKNGRSRERALEKKAGIERILSKPETERTKLEMQFLDNALGAKDRKNEGDRLRRRKLKELGLATMGGRSHKELMPRAMQEQQHHSHSPAGYPPPPSHYGYAGGYHHPPPPPHAYGMMATPSSPYHGYGAPPPPMYPGNDGYHPPPEGSSGGSDPYAPTHPPPPDLSNISHHHQHGDEDTPLPPSVGDASEVAAMPPGSNQGIQ